MRPVRLLLAVCASVSVLVTGCASGVRDSTGQVTAQATTDSFSVQVGDCTGPLPTDTTDELILVPCAQPHHWEAFHSTAVPGDEFPGASSLKRKAEKICTKEFATFAGISKKKSKLDLTMLMPTSQTWTQAGDREVVCLIGSSNGKTTGTLKDAGR